MELIMTTDAIKISQWAARSKWVPCYDTSAFVTLVLSNL